MPGKELVFDLFSYARRGPSRRDHLTPAEIEQVSRTVCRTPEVMVKVLSRGAQNTGAVRKHLDYIGRKGNLELETDEGERLQGRDAGEQLVEDWDLDLEADRRGVGLASTGQASPRLVHKILLSMPPGTPAKRVLEAARNFAREEFGLKHRYALTLHTDEPHPHVHLVVKAVSEQGVRLNIRKATLREWRREFARHLRDQRVAANATERAVRGSTKSPKLDGIHRAEQRGESRHTRARVESVAADLLRGQLGFELGKSTLLETRKTVERGWGMLGNILASEGRSELAAQVKGFVARMPPARTDREMIADALRGRVRDSRTHEDPVVR